MSKSERPASEATHNGPPPADSVDRSDSRGSSAAMWLAVVALLIAGTAAGAAIWVWLELAPAEPSDRVSTDQIEQLAARVDGALATQEQLEQQTSILAEGLDAVAADVSGLGRELQMLSEDFDQGLDQRLQAVHARIEEVSERVREAAGEQREVDRQLEQRLVLIETAALLQMGQRRAELASDFSGARAAFRSASRALRQAEDPRFSRAAGLIARELEALEAVEVPDWQELTARISGLSAATIEWPPRQPEIDRAGDTAEPRTEKGGWRASIRRAFGGLVRVTPRDVIPVSIEQIESAREQARLRLVAAELALARQDIGALQHQLGMLEALVEAWFDTDAAAVRRALEQIASLQAVELPPVPALGAAQAEIGRLLDSL